MGSNLFVKTLKKRENGENLRRTERTRREHQHDWRPVFRTEFRAMERAVVPDW
jgi:hypothetical protein